MRGFQTMKRFRFTAAIMVALSMSAGLSACGGKQTVAGDAPLSQQTAEERKAQAEKEKTMTPEELEAERQRLLDVQVDDALNAYVAKDVLDASDYKVIRKQLDNVLSQRPNDATVMFNIGVLEYEQGNEKSAAEWWQKAVDADSTHTAGLANLGTLKMLDGDMVGAKQIFETCVERSQTAPGCNINLALMTRNDRLKDGKLTRNDAQPAIDQLRFALGGDARSARAYADLARIYQEMGQSSLARLVCENAILLGIDEAPLHNQLGLIALSQNDVIVAYKEFQAAVQLDPKYLDAWMNIGAMALNFRDFSMALRAFEKVLNQRDKLSQDDLVDSVLSYGVAQRGLEQLDDAEVQYKEVLSLRPNDIRALYNLGVLNQEGRGDYKAAIGWFEQVVNAIGNPKDKLVVDAKKRIDSLHILLEFSAGDNG